MGKFGVSHIDGHDDVGGLTCMIANSRLPDNYEPGRIHLLALGCYIKLGPNVFSIFVGLRNHGGTPPLAPPGEDPSPHAIRCMAVCYPPESILTGGESVHGLAGLPDKSLFTLRPEMTGLV